MLLRELVGWLDAIFTRVGGIVLRGAVPFLAVAAVFTYYGQLHRKPSGDTYATVYTAVAIVNDGTIWLDRYLPEFHERAGERPYMLRTARDGHLVNAVPPASTVLALPVVALFSAAGVDPHDWETWMEAGFLTATITAALSVVVLFVVAARLTSRGTALLVAAVYAWATLTWTIAGQALWQHGGAMLALVGALWALIERRLLIAGAAIGAMIAFRPSAPIIALFLLPLIGRRLRDWTYFLAGAAPFGVALLVYNMYVFGAPLRQGYSGAHAAPVEAFGGSVLEGLAGLLLSPGRGLITYSPVLLFAFLGAMSGWKVPLYRWSALAACAYTIFIAQLAYWWGGESFGPRLLAEAIPLLALLLVPALESFQSKALRLAFALTALWSVFVQLIGASGSWIGSPSWEEQNRFSTWWRLSTNELVSALGHDSAGQRLAMTGGVLLLGCALGALAAWTFAGERQRPVEAFPTGEPSP